ncbi:MAG: STAS domain-containing protein [Desulfobacterales bacterium]|nr:STAS domain-containing protein [Desulfobacterales bacterium]
MKIETQKQGDVLIIIPLEKRIDITCAKEFKGKLVDWINEGSRQIVLNLAHVEFIDSSGLSVLVSSLKTIGKNGDLFLCEINSELVKNLFDLTRMYLIFKIFSSQDEAVRALTH